MAPESSSLPSQHSRGLYKCQDVAPSGPVPGEPRPEGSIPCLNAGTLAGPLVDAELMSQRNDFHLEGQARSESRPDY